jgi:hypothetical protein
MSDEAAEMSIASDLRKLRMRRAGLQYLDDYYNQIDAEQNDRGAAILACTFVENALETAVSRRFPGVAKVFSRLFEDGGPLEAFDAKLLLAQALEIYGNLTASNMNVIKHVRNTFAHSSIPILFSATEVAAACNTLTLLSPNPQRYREALPFSSPREKFTTTCEVTGTALLNYAAGCVRVRADLVPSNRMIPVTPEPLP